MKLSDAREFYYVHSGKTSEIVRQLALAGVAVVWLFKYEVIGVPKVPKELLWPLSLIVLCLTFDLLQYTVATMAWGIFHRSKERSGVTEDADFTAPPKINWPAITLFWLKVSSIFGAYLLLLRYLAETVIPR